MTLPLSIYILASRNQQMFLVPRTRGDHVHGRVSEDHLEVRHTPSSERYRTQGTFQ